MVEGSKEGLTYCAGNEKALATVTAIIDGMGRCAFCNIYETPPGCCIVVPCRQDEALQWILRLPSPARLTNAALPCACWALQASQHSSFHHRDAEVGNVPCSLGAALGPLLTSYLSQREGGFDNVFYMLYASSLAAAVLLSRLVYNEVTSCTCLCISSLCVVDGTQVCGIHCLPALCACINVSSWSGAESAIQRNNT